MLNHYQMLAFHIKYFLLALLLFITELLIGLYVHDALIRPFIGDFLVVVLIYCLVKSFLNSQVNITAIGVLMFAWIVEISQYLHLIDILGLHDSTVARLILGTTFSFTDMLMYALGIIMIVFFERAYNAKINTLN